VNTQASNAPLSLTRELSLVVQCSRTSIDRQAIEQCAKGVDWQAFVRVARWHGVSPLVSFNLERCDLEPVATPSLRELRGDFQRNSFDTARLSMELCGVIGLLSRCGIRSLPFKGPSLAASAYGDVWLRQFSDLDLMVRPDDVVAAKATLAEKGYRTSSEMSRQQEAVHVRRSPFAYSFTLFREGGPMVVDLHWRVAELAHPAFPRRLCDPWSRVVKSPLNGAEIEVLGPEDTLLFLSGHAAKHGWSRLRWICDIAQVVRSQPELDWNDALSCASLSGPIGERTLLIGVGLADRLFGSALPRDIQTLVTRDPIVRALVDEVIGELPKCKDDWPLWWPRSFESDALFLRMAESPARKARYFFNFCAWRAVATDAKDRAAVGLPAKLSFLYLMLRPIRLVREYGFRPLIEFFGLLRTVVKKT